MVVFPTFQQDMAMTVQPERKVTEATDMTPVASNTGLMIMPPPMPQTVPRTQAKKATRKQIKYTIILPLPLRKAA